MKQILYLMAAIAASPLLAFPQQKDRRSPVVVPTDRQQLDAFLQMPAAEVARKYFERAPYHLFAIRRLIELGDPVAIPTLRRAFEDEYDITRRQFIAAALVSLRDPAPQYFEYVAREAEGAARSDLPFPVLLEGSGNPKSEGIYRSDFLAVVERHELDLTTALVKAAIDLPAAVQALGEAADQRSFPILVAGLNSPNVLIVRESAFGLARLHNRAGIERIIAACVRHRAKERQMIAKALLYFDSRSAQRAARVMIADQRLFERWRLEVKLRGWQRAMLDTGR